MAHEVSSVPLSLTTMQGLPRVSTTRSSSRATRMPERELSTTSARHSRLKSSTTVRMRNLRLQASASNTKSSDQRWFLKAAADPSSTVELLRLLGSQPVLHVPNTHRYRACGHT